MKGYVKQRGDRYYAVIYEGRDPVTGKEHRRWHPAGTDRAEAERLAAAETVRTGATRSLTFRDNVTAPWLPAKKLHLATSTYRGDERNVQRHILPALGTVEIRRLRYEQIKALYDTLLHPTFGTGLAPKRLSPPRQERARRRIPPRPRHSHRRRRRSGPQATGTPADRRASSTEEQLRQLLRAAVGHRLFPLLWLTAVTGMRRNEVLGLKWPDIDFAKQRLHRNRGLVAVGYEVHQTRGKTRNRPPGNRAGRHDARRARRLARAPGGRVRRCRHRQRRGLGVHRR